MIETNRLRLRKFEERDLNEPYELLSDETVNHYLPWFPVKSLEEPKAFYEKRFKDELYEYAICLKETDQVIGYVKIETDDSHDFGYGMGKESWYQGIMSETGEAFIRNKEYHI